MLWTFLYPPSSQQLWGSYQPTRKCRKQRCHDVRSHSLPAASAAATHAAINIMGHGTWIGDSILLCIMWHQKHHQRDSQFFTLSSWQTSTQPPFTIWWFFSICPCQPVTSSFILAYQIDNDYGNIYVSLFVKKKKIPSRRWDPYPIEFMLQLRSIAVPYKNRIHWLLWSVER